MCIRRTSLFAFSFPVLALFIYLTPTWTQVTLDPSMIVPVSTVHKITKDHDIVVIRGVVSRQVENNKFIVRDDSGSIEVDFGRLKTMGISTGQNLTIRGEVHKYLTRARRIVATEAIPNSNSSESQPAVTPPPNLVPIWQAYFRASDGEIVSVGGKIVRRLESGEFVLRDDSGEILVDERFKTGGMAALSLGQSIIVTGEVDLYWGGPWREIEPRTIQPLQTPPPPSTVPIQLVVIPISDVLAKGLVLDPGSTGEIVTIKGELIRQIDEDEYMMSDDTGEIIIMANPRLFSHLGLQVGRSYTITGKIQVNPQDEVEILAMVITALPSEPRKEEAPIPVDNVVEIPIANVYYDYPAGAEVTVSGSIIRMLEDTGFVLQDNTGAIVVDHEAGRYQSLGLAVGRFLIVTGQVKSDSGDSKSIQATRVLVRERPGE